MLQEKLNFYNYDEYDEMDEPDEYNIGEEEDLEYDEEEY